MSHPSAELLTIAQALDADPTVDAVLDRVDEMARTIDTLLDDFRRRGVTPDVDLEAHDAFRAQRPRRHA